MSASLRILTYNTQLRSWGMEALAQETLFPTTSAESRAATIAKRILESPEDYDVVCLNEVVDDDARDVLRDALAAKYPNRVEKADVDNLALQIGTVAATPVGIALTLPIQGWLAAMGVAIAGFELFLSTKFEDSGLMIFSRLPFANDP